MRTLGSFGLLTAAGCTSVGDPTGEEPNRFLPRSSSALYPAMPNEKFPIPAVKPGQLPAQYQRRRVRYRTDEKPGTVIVDTRNFYLYHVEQGGRAMRYGVGLGRAGFAWSGRARIAWKRKWPKWTPPGEMIRREPQLSKWSAANGGMPPGLNNPLGSRALYIFQGNRDTLYPAPRHSRSRIDRARCLQRLRSPRQSGRHRPLRPGQTGFDHCCRLA